MPFLRPTFALASVVPLVFGACSVLPGYEVDTAIGESTIPGSPVDTTIPADAFPPLPIDTNLEAESKKRGVPAPKHAYLTSLTFRATPHTKPSGNFDFLSSVHVYIHTTAKGLKQVEIASVAPVAPGKTTLSFKIAPSVDLAPYLDGHAEIITTAAGKLPSSDFSYDGDLVVEVKL